MIEPSHLKIMLALHEKGTLTQAADSLCLTQSALSHQIRYLEKKLEVKLWQRCGRRLRLTAAGELLLQTAYQVLPALSQTENAIKALADGQQGLLRIGVECFPCHEWLTKVVAKFLTELPNIDIDIIRQFQFSGLEGLKNHHVDLLITPDINEQKEILNIPLFQYQQVLVVANQHPLAQYSHIQAKQLSDQQLLTFPIEQQRLDIFKRFLWPANVQPKTHKKIESLALMLQLVEHQRGVCVLPLWLAEAYQQQFNISLLTIGEQGIYSTLYATIKEQDQQVSYLQSFVELAKQSLL